MKALILEGAEFVRIPRHLSAGLAGTRTQSAREWKMWPLTELKHKELHTKKAATDTRGWVFAEPDQNSCNFCSGAVSPADNIFFFVFSFFLNGNPQRLKRFHCRNYGNNTTLYLCSPFIREWLHFSSSVPRSPKRTAGTHNSSTQILYVQ